MVAQMFPSQENRLLLRINEQKLPRQYWQVATPGSIVLWADEGGHSSSRAPALKYEFVLQEQPNSKQQAAARAGQTRRKGSNKHTFSVRGSA
jgi:hypothetical protein